MAKFRTKDINNGAGVEVIGEFGSESAGWAAYSKAGELPRKHSPAFKHNPVKDQVTVSVVGDAADAGLLKSFMARQPGV